MPDLVTQFWYGRGIVTAGMKGVAANGFHHEKATYLIGGPEI
jgi:hypothetical protein